MLALNHSQKGPTQGVLAHTCGLAASTLLRYLVYQAIIDRACTHSVGKTGCGTSFEQAVWETVSDQELHEAFRVFASFGAGTGTPKSAPGGGPPRFELDSGRFVKLVRDSGLLGGRLTATAVELIFSRVKPKVRRAAACACVCWHVPASSELPLSFPRSRPHAPQHLHASCGM